MMPPQSHKSQTKKLRNLSRTSVSLSFLLWETTYRMATTDALHTTLKSQKSGESVEMKPFLSIFSAFQKIWAEFLGVSPSVWALKDQLATFLSHFLGGELYEWMKQGILLNLLFFIIIFGPYIFSIGNYSYIL